MKKTIYKYVDEDGGVGETIPFHSHKYSPDNKYIEIEVSSKARQLFTMLKEKKGSMGYQFTQAISKNLLKLDLSKVNKHTLKMQLLLEMISNYQHSKRKYISLDELNGYFGTKYSRWAEIDRRILTKVKKDIDLYSSFSFVYEAKEELQGTGRPKITGITIDIQDNHNLFNI